MLTSEREEARGRASVYSRQHREDINTIGAALIEQADRREWCGEFDDLVEETNRRLHIDLPTRSRSYRIEVPVTVTVALCVTAPDDESAIEAAQEFTSGGRRRSARATPSTSGGARPRRRPTSERRTMRTTQCVASAATTSWSLGSQRPTAATTTGPWDDSVTTRDGWSIAEVCA